MHSLWIHAGEGGAVGQEVERKPYGMCLARIRRRARERRGREERGVEAKKWSEGHVVCALPASGGEREKKEREGLGK